MKLLGSWILRLKVIALDIFDLVSFLIFVTGVVLFIRFFIFNPYTVVGQSMEPVFSQNDFIVVDKITPKFGQLKRGDIIVFVPEGKTLPFIKRIIGLPGEKIVVENNGVYICDPNEEDIASCEKLDERYLSNITKTTTTMCNITEFVIDESGYFVMGDNREHSTDSRCCFGLGCYEGANFLVHEKDMIGKVAIKLYPEVEAHW